MDKRKVSIGIMAIASLSAMACRQQSVAAVSRPSEVSQSASSTDDLQFLDMMTMHHERAVELWQQAVTRAVHPELRLFAARAVEEQRREMFLMHMWRDRWFTGAADTNPSRDSAIAGQGMPVWRPASITGQSFDREFLTMMVSHHRQAASMARRAVARTELPEVRKLATIIADQQDEEVRTMEAWQRSWFGAPAIARESPQ